jgi:hypothetical protein
MGRREKETELTGRTDRRYPIDKAHMNRYHIIRRIRRGFGMGREGSSVE